MCRRHENTRDINHDFEDPVASQYCASPATDEQLNNFYFGRKTCVNCLLKKRT